MSLQGLKHPPLCALVSIHSDEPKNHPMRTKALYDRHAATFNLGEPSMNQLFVENDLIYNRRSREDGRVLRCHLDGESIVYEVAVPINRHSWGSGAVTAIWPAADVGPSSNKLLL